MTLLFYFLLLMTTRANLLPYRTPETGTPFYHDPPRLDCSSEGIQFYVKPIGNFSGHIYAKGFFFSDTCHSSFVDSPTPSPMVLNIPYRGDCNVRRHHTSNPPAVSYEVTVVIQRHPLLVTAGDRAYRLNCVYKQLDTHVSSRIDVNDLTTMPAIQESSKGPLCHYDVLAQTLQGLPLKFANVGDAVVHRWTCDSETHGFLVHSCIVRNEAGEEYRLIDERGCVVDTELVPDPIYKDDLSLVYTTMKAFKFADQIMVHFSCQITLCRKAEQGCEGIAPPTCNQMDLAPVPVEYRGQETSTTDWQKVISDSLQELNRPAAREPMSPSTSQTYPYSRSAVYVSSKSSLNFQQATTLPFDSSMWIGNEILNNPMETSSRVESTTPQMENRINEERNDKYGLEIVDASNLEKESGLPTTWVDRGEGYQTKMLSSSLNGLPEEDVLPFPEAANVYYGNRRPRSRGSEDRLTVEVEAAEMAVFTNDSPMIPHEVSPSSDHDPETSVVALRLNLVQTWILSCALVSEMALLLVIILQRHFYKKSIRRLKEKQGMPDY